MAIQPTGVKNSSLPPALCMVLDSQFTADDTLCSFSCAWRLYASHCSYLPAPFAEPLQQDM